MNLHKRICAILLSLYAIMVIIVGIIDVAIVIGILALFMWVTFWVFHRSSLTSTQIELYLVPVAVLFNTAVVFLMTDLSLNIKVGHSIYFSLFYFFDVIIFYRNNHIQESN